MKSLSVHISHILLGVTVVTVCACRQISFSHNMSTNNDSKTEYIGRIESPNEEYLTPELLLSLGRLSDPQLSPDGNFILYGVSYNSIEENRSCRNLLVVTPDGSENYRITEEAKSITCARWCDGGRRIAYIQDGQIWCGKLKKVDKDEYRITKRVKLSDIPNGVSEFAISPDESMIMYISTVKSSVKSPHDIWPDLDKADAIVTENLMYRHWDHWVKEIPHTFVSYVHLKDTDCVTQKSSTDILGAGEAGYELPMEPYGGIEQLSWSPDSRYIAYSCKKKTGKEYAFSTDSEIYIYSVRTKTSALLPMGGGYDTQPVWSPDGDRLCWISMKRNGYESDKERLMVADLDVEALPRDIERGVISPVYVKDLTADFKYNAADPIWYDDNTIFFNALNEGIQSIYKITVQNQVKIDRVTDDDLWYDFSSPFGFIKDKNELILLTSRCSMNFPTELVAVKVDDDGEELANFTAITNENGHILINLLEPIMEKRYIKTVDGKDMLTWVMYPPNFDKKKVYPAIEICLGGPQGALSQSWSYRWNYCLMASQGYIVIMPNRRGTTSFGQEWVEQISGDYIGLNMQDYLSAAREFKAEPYVGKIAACGASYGGYSVYYLCGIHENTFDAFIAHAGIFNEEHMYVTTEEMWFPNWDNGGTPDECHISDQPQMGPAGDGKTFGGILQGGSPWSNSPKAVRHYENSPHKLVTKWNTPLLVMHGGMDFRVPVDQGMAAYNAAQLMGVPSKMVIFPDETHWVQKPQNALMWHREYFDWLNRWCMPSADTEN